MHKLLPIGILAAITFISSAEARTARCELVVKGRLEITGPCEFEPVNDGTGSFYAYDGGSTIFAVLLAYEDGAQGHWNEGESHAHSPLGDMKRSKQDAACWVSEALRLCAW